MFEPLARFIRLRGRCGSSRMDSRRIPGHPSVDVVAFESEDGVRREHVMQWKPLAWMGRISYAAIGLTVGWS
jgi:hypothetical protein